MLKNLLGKKKIMLILIIVLFLMTLFNPLRRSEESIRRGILEYTPIGSTNDEVMQFIEEEYRNKEIFYYGSGNVDVCLGKYRKYRDYTSFILVTSVVVAWRFDKDFNLEEVYVKKYTEGT